MADTTYSLKVRVGTAANRMRGYTALCNVLMHLESLGVFLRSITVNQADATVSIVVSGPIRADQLDHLDIDLGA